MEKVNLKQLVWQFELEQIQKALEFTGHNKQRAAALLSIERTTLVAKCHKYGIRLQAPYRPTRVKAPDPDINEGHL